MERVEEGTDLVRTELENYQHARKLLEALFPGLGLYLTLSSKLILLGLFFFQDISENQSDHNKQVALKF